MSSHESSNSNEIPLLTFNSLYNLRNEEKKNKNFLQKLPEEFYEALDKFFQDKKEDIKKLGSDPDKVLKEKNILKNSQKITTELINLRCMKISNIAINNELEGDDVLSSDNILKYESEFFESVKKSVKKIKKKYV